jgi:hypothetical protein
MDVTAVVSSQTLHRLGALRGDFGLSPMVINGRIVSLPMAVGRFQVMAMLQAARAFTLGLPLESAHSWGLNRAIFYAAAKRRLAGGAQTKPGKETATHPAGGRAKTDYEEYHLGDELAFRDKSSGADKPLFAIGGKPQTEADFKRQIQARFQGSSFKEAWDEALDYVQHFPREGLESQDDFFSDVYRPKRDEFAKKWSEMSSVRGKTPSTP